MKFLSWNVYAPAVVAMSVVQELELVLKLGFLTLSLSSHCGGVQAIYQMPVNSMDESQIPPYWA